MQHIDIKEIFENQELLNNNVTVCGWVRTARDSKNVAFIELNDGTSLKHLQIVIEKDSGIELEQCLKLGTALKVEGKLVPSANNIVEINASSIEVLGTAPADYPLQKKRHTLEFLRTMPHLRLRTNTFNAVFRVRSVMAAAIHEFFQSKNFVYVNPPLITGSDCEGAGEMFQVTTIGYQNGKYESAEDYYADDFFGKKAGLSVSAQLEGETAALAMGKIYTFGPSFRAENSNTPKHLAEFWHVEPEVAFAELPDVIALAEEMVKFVIGRVLEKCPKEMEFFDKFMENGLIERLNKLISEKIFNKAVFVTNYPKEIKSFYMKQNPDGKTVAAVDLLVPGVGEIIGGSEREADYDKLLEAMKVRNRYGKHQRRCALP